MWPKSYKDYPMDEKVIKYPLEPGKGIIGCQMHEINGWGNSLHEHPVKRKKGFIQRLLESLFGEKREWLKKANTPGI